MTFITGAFNISPLILESLCTIGSRQEGAILAALNLVPRSRSICCFKSFHVQNRMLISSSKCMTFVSQRPLCTNGVPNHGEILSMNNDDLILRKIRQNAALSDDEHRLLVIQPHFKWGRNRFHLESIDHMLDEAVSLVHSLPRWSVIERHIVPIRKQDPQHFFGKGKLEELTALVKLLKKERALTAVFLNISRLALTQHSQLEALWNAKVLDRFGLVVQIFKERAVTSEAKLQVELAELGYIRTRLTLDDEANYDQQRGGAHGVAGAGETQLEVARRFLNLRRQKLQGKLESIKKQRNLIRQQKMKRRVPVISVVGHTNAGKTTLIKALTRDSTMRPDERLFATLDVSAHRCKLPCGMAAVLVDTVGFISDLPHELLESFSATLEDIAYSDLVIHMRDSSHPEVEAQKSHVLEVLQTLKLPKHLFKNIIEVQNKVDLRYLPTSNENSFDVSAKHEIGLQLLWSSVETTLFKITGRQIVSLVIPHDGPHLSWLHHEATVCHSESISNDELKVDVVMDAATLRKYNTIFGKI